MPKLPVVSGKETVKALQKIGFNLVSQKGSHIKLTRIVGKSTQKVIIPNHRFIKLGTLRNGILKVVDISVDEFTKLLKK